MENLDSLAVADGVRVEGSGSLLRGPEGLYFHPPSVDQPDEIGPSAVPLVFHSGQQTEIDLHATPKWVSVVGTWRDGKIEVESVSPLSESPFRWPSALEEPPAQVDDGLPLDEIKSLLRTQEIRELQDNGVILQLSPVQSASSDRHCVVVATAEPERAERVLRPRIGDALVIVSSAWDAETVSSVADGLARHDTILQGIGQGMDAQGQVRVRASVTRVTPGFAEWAASVPEGLLDLEIWLKPAR